MVLTLYDGDKMKLLVPTKFSALKSNGVNTISTY